MLIDDVIVNVVLFCGSYYTALKALLKKELNIAN